MNEETRRFENNQKMSELSRILDMEATGVSRLFFAALNYGSTDKFILYFFVATEHPWKRICDGRCIVQGQEWTQTTWLFV